MKRITVTLTGWQVEYLINSIEYDIANDLNKDKTVREFRKRLLTDIVKQYQVAEI